jgi:hypothetical protein
MLLWARLITDMLGVGGELGVAGGRRRIAESQVDVDLFQTLGVGFATATDHDDVGAFFEQCAVEARAACQTCLSCLTVAMFLPES